MNIQGNNVVSQKKKKEGRKSIFSKLTKKRKKNGSGVEL